ncbi:MAG: dTDP-4-dehydrorhamnose reductase [Nitrospinae bacterium]|nr:dTDP-4-dehydrorhamnose reductase [Nitrospinota bacterium]
MRILLIGKDGQIGWELQKELAGLGELTATGKNELDLCDPARIRQTVREIKPGLIINAAAYTAVDKAEEEPDLAMAVNGTAPGILAEAAKKIGSAMIHYSTDYVFDGKIPSGAYQEEDKPNPLSVYGQTKLAGEQAIVKQRNPYIILRTSGVYGSRGKNFMRTILNLADEGKDLRIVNDQVSSPTWCGAIAKATRRIILSLVDPSEGQISENMNKVSGIYHLSCKGETSWYGFAKAILDYSKEAQPAKMIPIPSSEYPTPAKRPARSVLANTKIARDLGIEMPLWEEALKQCLGKDPSH